MEERAYDERVMEKAGELLADERLRALEEMNGEEKSYLDFMREKAYSLLKEKRVAHVEGVGRDIAACIIHLWVEPENSHHAESS